jgi:hypothetical protein
MEIGWPLRPAVHTAVIASQYRQEEMYCIAHMNDELDAVLMGWELVVAGAGGWMEPRLFVASCNGLSSNQ